MSRWYNAVIAASGETDVDHCNCSQTRHNSSMTCSSGSHVCPARFDILGSGLDAEKLKRRVSCALGGLGWRANIHLRADAERAIALGATRDPVLLLDGALFAQGLPRTEELEALLLARLGRADERVDAAAGPAVPP